MALREGYGFSYGSPRNPFEITKAVDFNDNEINLNWVDWPAPGGFAEWFDIRSPMARIIQGGKGTGRTHLMRHFSFPLQAIRGGEDPLEQVRQDGVLGVYVVCSGLNSSRFHGRGVDPNTWQVIFSYYADIWLAQAILEAFEAATAVRPPSTEIERAITQEVRSLLQMETHSDGASLGHLRKDLYGIQRNIDLNVNNSALYQGTSLDLSIQPTPGELVFGVPKAIRNHFKPLSDITFLYLIDEFENFDESQQRYINTLVREKSVGTSFMIGVRTFGLRTLATLSAGEENKRGSEFEEIWPDRDYIERERERYQEFCYQVVGRRLSQSGHIDDADQRNLTERIRRFFDVPRAEHVERLIIERYEAHRRPYLNNLRRQLEHYAGRQKGLPVDSKDIDFVIEAIRVPSRPLLEKVNIFLIYRAWARGQDLTKVASGIIEARSSELPDGTVQPNRAQRTVLAHFVTDLQAQLWNHMRRRQMYAGIEDFITMSDGLLRNLIVILKNVYRWAVFNGEDPFGGNPISLESQRKGVLEAADWFLTDSKPMGRDGEDVSNAIHRLGEMFRLFRFSDKPVESSLASFSADLSTCSQRAQEVIRIAEERSLLVRVEKGQRARSTGLVEPKFHLNRLLSPKWDLPIARRGAIRLNTAEVNAIFDSEYSEQYQYILNQRLRRMDAPFLRTKDEDQNSGTIQNSLDLEIP